MIRSSWPSIDFRARPFAEQNPVTGLYVDGNELAGLVAATRANGEDLALRRLFLGGVRNDDPVSSAQGPAFHQLSATTAVQRINPDVQTPHLYAAAARPASAQVLRAL